MKTFDEMFPNLKWEDTYLIFIDGDEMRVGLHQVKCGICNNHTKFYSISFMAAYCSPNCLKAEWERYAEQRKPFDFEEEEVA